MFKNPIGQRSPQWDVIELSQFSPGLSWRMNWPPQLFRTNNAIAVAAVLQSKPGQPDKTSLGMPISNPGP